MVTRIVLAVFVALTALGAQAAVQELSPFNTVSVCVPFTVQVAPSKATGNGSYALSLDAGSNVSSAITATVLGDTLYLETAGFISTEPIQVTILMPADKLRRLNHFSLSSVYVAPGFNVSSFVARSSLSGNIYVQNMTAGDVLIQESGTGEFYLGGELGNVTIVSTGITKVYVEGVSGTVNVALGGISDLYVRPSSANATIQGATTGISTVQYTQGQCTVQSTFMFGSSCQMVPGLTWESPTNVTWTPSLQAVGGFSCAIGADLGVFGMPAEPVSKPAGQQAATTTAGAAATVGAAQVPPVLTDNMAQPQLPTGAAPSPASEGSGLVEVPPAVVAAPNPYDLSQQNAAGSQVQRGSVGPGGSAAQSASTGQQFASASSVAGPGGVSTQTANDQGGFGAQTSG